MVIVHPKGKADEFMEETKRKLVMSNEGYPTHWEAMTCARLDRIIFLLERQGNYDN